MPDFHAKVIQQGRSLGYTPNDKGVCFGFTMRWIEASLTAGVDRFNQYAKLIGSNVSQQRIDAIRQKVKEKKSLSDEEKTLLDLPAFYEGLLVYHQPAQYSELLGSSRQMDLDRTTPLASSKDIEDMGGLSNSLIQLDIYTQASLVTYLEKLESIIQQSNCPLDTKIAIKLADVGHAIGVTYDVNTKLWTIMDINQESMGSESIDLN